MQYVSTAAAQDVIHSAESGGAKRRNAALVRTRAALIEPEQIHGLSPRVPVFAGPMVTVKVERFVVVGAACALLSNAAVIILARYGFGSVTASLLAFGPVLLTGYALHSIFTFGSRLSRLTFARYALATAANFPLSVATLYMLGTLGLPIAVAAPATTALLFLWNYVAARWAWDSARRMLWKR
jgi:putative flippase GtrA